MNGHSHKQTHQSTGRSVFNGIFIGRHVLNPNISSEIIIEEHASKK